MVRKLYLAGHVHNRPEHRVNEYHSWPKGVCHRRVQKMIDAYKKAFDKVSVRIDHMLDDDNYPY